MRFSTTVTVQESETDCPASEIGADRTDISGGGNSIIIIIMNNKYKTLLYSCIIITC